MMLITKCFFMQESRLIYINIPSDNITRGGTILNAYVTRYESITRIILGMLYLLQQPNVELNYLNEIETFQLLINNLSKNKYKKWIKYIFLIHEKMNNIYIINFKMNHIFDEKYTSFFYV